LVHGDNQHVRLDLFDDVRQVILVLDLTHNLNVGLVGDGSHHQFPHQARMIRDQYTHSFHERLPSAEHRSPTPQAQGSKAIYERIPSSSSRGTEENNWRRTKADSSGTKARTN